MAGISARISTSPLGSTSVTWRVQSFWSQSGFSLIARCSSARTSGIGTVQSTRGKTVAKIRLVPGPVLERVVGEMGDGEHQPPLVPEPQRHVGERQLLHAPPLTLDHHDVVEPCMASEQASWRLACRLPRVDWAAMPTSTPRDPRRREQPRRRAPRPGEREQHLPQGDHDHHGGAAPATSAIWDQSAAPAGCAAPSTSTSRSRPTPRHRTGRLDDEPGQDRDQRERVSARPSPLGVRRIRSRLPIDA